MMSFSCSGSPDTGCFLNFWTYGTMFVMSYTVPSAVQACIHSQRQTLIAHTGRVTCIMAQGMWYHIQCHQLYTPANVCSVTAYLRILGLSYAFWHKVCGVIYSAIGCTCLHTQSASDLAYTYWAVHMHSGTRYVVSYTMPSAVHACKRMQCHSIFAHTGLVICILAQGMWCHIQCHRLYMPAYTISIRPSLHVLGSSYAFWHEVCGVIYNAISCTHLQTYAVSQQNCAYWASHEQCQ